MPKPSSIEQLSSRQVEELLQDLRLTSQGAEIVFAVDASEVIDFCFPAQALNSASSNVLADLADQQAALYHAFFVRPVYPVLLPEYAQELVGFRRHVEQEAGSVYGPDELVDLLIKTAGSVGDEARDARGDRELKNLAQNHFNIILAISLGIVSFGIRRLTDVMRMRLRTLVDADPEGAGDDASRAVLQRIQAAYRESPLVDQISRELESEFLRGRDPESLSAQERLEHTRRGRADRIDARGVDRVLQLNAALQRAWEAGELPRQYLVLYLSSAWKTSRIFDIRAVSEALPTVSRRTRYPIWRTREQLFAYVANRGPGLDPAQEAEKTAKKLRTVRDTLVRMEEMQRGLGTLIGKNECDRCVRDGGMNPDCEWLEFCTAIQELEGAMRDRTSMAENLGLLGSVHQYTRILEKTSRSRSHSDWISAFQRLAKLPQVEKFAAMQQQLQQDLLMAQTMSALALTQLLAEPAPGGIRGSDVVTNAAQHLPIRPRLDDPRCHEVASLVVQYYKLPATMQGEYREMIGEAASKFSRLEELPDSDEVAGEREVVRCLLLLVLPSDDGSKLAYEHALRMSDRYRHLEREFRYVMVWAARRTGEYALAERQASSAVRLYADDGRFFHGRSLAIAAWLEDEKQRKTCRRTFADAVKDAHTALDLYRAEDAGANRDLIGVNLNNLAYLHAFNPHDRVFDLAKAREALDELLESVPPETWDPTHPEYFHTEAMVLLQEGLAERARRAPPADVRARLTRAYTQAASAVRLFPDKPEHDRLLQKVRRELASVRESARHPTTA